MADELTFDATRPFIGVFDSGAGGISVLGALMHELPAEDFIYFGDSAYTPYGERSDEWIVERSQEICDALARAGAKAVVIACNTATATAARILREEYPDMPIIGVEPALKPATETAGVERILVMATPITINQDKYQKLAETYTGNHEVSSVECPGLAARIEQGNLDAPDLADFIESLVGDYRDKVDGVVLGCTHYAFIAPLIKTVVGDVLLFDGAHGTARQLHRRLDERGLEAPSSQQGSVRFFTSDPTGESIDRYKAFFRAACDEHFML